MNKLLVALIASAFALGAYAQTPAPKAEPKAESKMEAKKAAKPKSTKSKSTKAKSTKAADAKDSRKDAPKPATKDAAK